jgi:shikimate kinase
LFDGVVVWVDHPLRDLIPRIPIDGRRPLAANSEQLEQLYGARVDTYRQAHLRVSAARASLSSVVDRILDALHLMPPIFDRDLP